MAKIIDRRDFSRLSLAAFGGALAGSSVLAQNPAPIAPPAVNPPKGAPRPSVAPPKKPATTAPADKATDATEDAKAAEKAASDKKAADAKKKKDDKPKEIHICRGLNTCANKGKSGDNKCAGQGTCATTPNSPHECATGNACRNQGGCDATVGRNQCAGYGEGQVPIIEEQWGRVRKAFEERMKRLNRQIGKAPPSEWEAESLRDKVQADAKAIAEAEAAKAEEESQAAAQNPRGKNVKNPKTTNKGSTARPGTKETVKGTPKKPATTPPKGTKPAEQEEDSTDILGELTGDKDAKKTPPKTAPKKPAPK